MDEIPSHLQKYFDAFGDYVHKVDPLALVILKGHLIVESALDNILSVLFFYPEHLREARLGFVQKVHIVRAFALRKNKAPIWPIILAVNELRNEITHNLAGERRKKKTDQ